MEFLSKGSFICWKNIYNRGQSKGIILSSSPFKNLFDKYLIRSANSIYHDEFRRYLVESEFIDKIMGVEFSSIDRQDEFLEYYSSWIQSSKLNKIRGLESFPFRYISLGCTQALDEFHYWCAQNNKTIRMFRGEYPYNRDCIPFDWDKDFIEDSPLKQNDAVIISAPFSGYGAIHEQWSWLLEKCAQLDIPILVDCAFFGTCFSIDLDLSHPSIKFVAFSTTKGLSCGNYRNGILFSKSEEGHLAIQTEWHHGIHFNVSVGLELMKKFSPDHLPNTYRDSYLQTCELLNLKPTQCVHLALGLEGWEHFSRDGVCNRVGVKNLVRDHYRATKKNKTFQLPDY